MEVIFRNVNFFYNYGMENEKRALKDINLCLESNLIHGIIGPIGSGKSTMLELMNGITKPTTGEIIIGKYNLNKRNFKFNKFYFIENTPYVVTEIEDFNPINSQPTMVTMQRVIDINNYTDGQIVLVNDIRSIDGYFNITTQSGEDPYSTDLYCEYYVSNSTLVTESGFNINGVDVESTLSYPDINLTVDRPYQSDYVNIKPYIVYDGLKYYGELQKISFIPFSVTFSNFTKTVNGDNYDISLDYIVNMNITSQGFLINGVEYIATGTTTPIELTLINNEYNIMES